MTCEAAQHMLMWPCLYMVSIMHRAAHPMLTCLYLDLLGLAVKS